MERPNCFAKTKTGYMPGIVLGRDETGMIVVETLDRKRRYSFPEGDVWSLEDARRRMRQARIDRVIGRYVFETLMDTPHIVRCYNPEHPRRSNYVLAEGKQGWTCTCPNFAFSKNCKHAEAIEELERLESPELPRVILNEERETLVLRAA
ncbi:MAG: SWIM zinc finger domain-containing protein [Chloroflexi bacterium]|nr:SWIM zinc finger domain-containing protein [Chloroflexota bacterium]